MSEVKFFGDKALAEIQRDVSGIVPRIAEKIAGRAKEIVVVDSGKLKDSISADGNTVIAGTDYAAAVEFGTATKAARPYFRPAIEQFNKVDLEQSLR